MKKQADINKAQGEAAAITQWLTPLPTPSERLHRPSSSQAANKRSNSKVAERAVDAFAQLAQKNNPHRAEQSRRGVALIGSAMALIKARRPELEWWAARRGG